LDAGVGEGGRDARDILRSGWRQLGQDSVAARPPLPHAASLGEEDGMFGDRPGPAPLQGRISHHPDGADIKPFSLKAVWITRLPGVMGQVMDGVEAGAGLAGAVIRTR